MDKPTAAHNPEVGGSSPPPATIEKPSDYKALRPRSLGFLFVLRGQKRDFSGTVPLICCAVGIKRTAQASTPRPLYTIGLLVLSGAGQNNHDWQRQNKEDNHKAHPLASMVAEKDPPFGYIDIFQTWPSNHPIRISGNILTIASAASDVKFLLPLMM